jgi:Protein of unknown function (DUF1592)/Protein of unknown function (DUF1588)/Protein of unknown function (DUF1595)/Protein of unknown function (DUF1585)/Protein of unknown function (DUF1587)
MVCSSRSVPLSLLLLASCTGSIGVSSQGGPIGGDADLSGSGGSGDGGSVPPDPDDPFRPTLVECRKTATPKPGRAPLRRLSRIEYDRTMRALIGDNSAPSKGLPLDVIVPIEKEGTGFDNEASHQSAGGDAAENFFETGETMARNAIANLVTLAPCSKGENTDETCVRSFITAFGMRTYRRPLTSTEVSDLLTTYQAGRQSADVPTGFRLLLTRMFSSPHFLYRPEFGVPDAAQGIARLTSWEMASRLSYLFLNSMPDEALFAAAQTDKLRTPDDIAEQARRLVKHPDAPVAMRRFFTNLFQLDRIAGLPESVTKDPGLFPGFAAVAPAMREEVVRTIDHVLWSDEPSLGRLFSLDYTFMNKALATFLKVPGAESMSTEFSRVELSDRSTPIGPTRRRGILGASGILAAFGKPRETSPILRGRFVLQQMLCVRVPDPPPGIAPAPTDPTMTTRERFESHGVASCASCHRSMDPIGFAFEDFDAAGRAQTLDKGKPVDTSGVLTATDVNGPFANGAELSEKLADSEQLRQCFSQHMFRYAHGRLVEGEEDGEDRGALEAMACQFNKNNDNLQELFVAVTQTDSFRFKKLDMGAGI